MRWTGTDDNLINVKVTHNKALQNVANPIDWIDLLSVQRNCSPTKTERDHFLVLNLNPKVQFDLTTAQFNTSAINYGTVELFCLNTHRLRTDIGLISSTHLFAAQMLFVTIAWLCCDSILDRFNSYKNSIVGRWMHCARSIILPSNLFENRLLPLLLQ